MRPEFLDKQTTAYIFWGFRWLLVILLLGVFGMFLEGPPTRVVVRSSSFYLAFYLLSFLTALFLYQVHRLPLLAVIIPAWFIPAGFIHYAQAYYHGGKNLDYEQSLTVFFWLMFLIGLVYLYSLCVIEPKKARGNGSLSAPDTSTNHEKSDSTR